MHRVRLQHRNSTLRSNFHPWELVGSCNVWYETFDLRILGLSGSGMAKDEAFQPQEVSHLMLLYL